MSAKDKIKAKIDIVKALLLSFMAALFGIFGYTAIHYSEFDMITTIATIAGIIILGAMIAFCGRVLKLNLINWRKNHDGFVCELVCIADTCWLGSVCD